MAFSHSLLLHFSAICNCVKKFLNISFFNACFNLNMMFQINYSFWPIQLARRLSWMSGWSLNSVLLLMLLYLNSDTLVKIRLEISMHFVSHDGKEQADKWVYIMSSSSPVLCYLKAPRCLKNWMLSVYLCFFHLHLRQVSVTRKQRDSTLLRQSTCASQSQLVSEVVFFPGLPFNGAISLILTWDGAHWWRWLCPSAS